MHAASWRGLSHFSLELNRRRLDSTPVVQRQLNREPAGDGADRRLGVPVENELGRAETESAVSFRSGRWGIQQNAGRNGRQQGRNRIAGGRARLHQLERAQVADRVSIGIQNFPFQGNCRALVDRAREGGRSDCAGCA